MSDFWFSMGLFVGTTFGTLAFLEASLTENQPRAKEVVIKLRALILTLRNRPTFTDARLDWREEAIEITKVIMNWQMVIEKVIELKTDLRHEWLEPNLIHFQIRPFY